jgi:hypothetical protein
MSWRPLGAVLPTELTSARLQLHWAAQVVSAPGTTLLEARDDFGHTNLAWNTELGVLAGRAVGPQSLASALAFESLELALLDGRVERSSRSLAGSSLQEALGWLRGQLGAEPALSPPEHEMPRHPVADGAPFSEKGRAARAELAAWFANAAHALRDAVREQPGASSVRCWPHHFDLASLLVLDSNEESEEARSVGVGFSPGDASYAQPYFYVTPWPYPSSESLPSLSSGARWHEEGWTGAVLLGESIVAQRHDAQARFVEGAISEAMSASLAALRA